VELPEGTKTERGAKNLQRMENINVYKEKYMEEKKSMRVRLKRKQREKR